MKDPHSLPTSNDSLNKSLPGEKDSFAFFELHAQKDQYNINIGYWVWDTEKHSLDFSASIVNIFDLDSNSKLQSPDDFLQYIHPEDLQKVQDSQFFQMTTSHNVAVPTEIFFRIVTPKGEVKYLQGKHGPNLADQKKHIILKNTGIMQEVTELRRLRQALNKEKKALIKQQEEFISLMSHEFRTPINAILGMSHLLEEVRNPEDIATSVKTLKHSSNYLLALVDNILDYAKCKRDEIEFKHSPLDLEDLLTEIVEGFTPYANEKNLPLLLDLPEKDTPQVYGDPLRLRQIVMNLTDNAIKFTQQGHVKLELSYSLHKDLSSVDIYISIIDTGIGIPYHVQQKIFEPFTQADTNITRQYDGSGLGLSVTRELVNGLGGIINVDSEPNKGSTFVVHFNMDACSFDPTIFNQQENKSSLKRHKQSHIKGVRILYVEDVEANRVYLKMLGKSRDWRIDVAKDGYEALEKIKTREYDFVFMDIMMPGMDGYKTTQLIRNLPHPYFQIVPIIALTASVNIPHDKTYQEVGMNDYLIKPADPGRIQEIIYVHATEYCKKVLAWRPDIDFVPIQNTFGDSKSDYAHLLRIMLKDFISNRDMLLTALKEKDMPAIKDVRHKLIGSLLAMDQADLSNYFQAIRLLTQDLQFDANFLYNHTSATFQNIIYSIEDQLKGHQF